MNLQLTLALRYLAGRRLRTVLTTSAVVFGVTVIFGMNILLPSMMEAIQISGDESSGTVDLTIFHVAGVAFPDTLVGKLQAINGVRAVSPTMIRTVNLPADFIDHDPTRPDLITAVSLVGVDPAAARSMRSYPLVAGRFLEEGDSANAIISSTLAEAFSAKLGEQIPIPSVDGLSSLTIVGILPPQAYSGNEQILVTLPEAQLLIGEEKRINSIEVDLDPGLSDLARSSVIQNIKTAIGEDYQIGNGIAGAELVASFKLGQAALDVFGFLALFMGAFIIFNTFRTVVVERRHDIGMLRAVGASRGTIIGMILIEGLVQGLVGTGIGLILGYLFGAGIIGLVEPVMAQFVNLKPAPAVVSPSNLILSAALGVGVTVFSGLAPAIQASWETPLEALSFSSGEAAYRRYVNRASLVGLLLVSCSVLALLAGTITVIAPAGIAFLVGLVLLAPALIQPIARLLGRLLAWIYARQGTGVVAQSNLIRQPSRAAITASATMLGLAVIVASSGLLASLVGAMDEVIKKSLGSDYLFQPPSIALWNNNVGASESLAGQLRSLDTVGKVSTLRFSDTMVDGHLVSLLGIDPSVFPDVSGLFFQQGDETAYRDLALGRSMIVNGAFLAVTGTHVGDTVQLITPDGQMPYRIVAMASDMLNVKVTTAYISQANLLADFGQADDVFIQLDLKPGANPGLASREIESVAGKFPQFRVIPGKVYTDRLMSEVNLILAGLYVLLAMLSLPSLIAMLNTLAIGVIERTREIGTLRAVGATRRQIHTMVIAEALLHAAIGSIFGTIFGLYLGFIFVSAFNPIFPLVYYFPWTGILAAILIGVLFGVIAAIIPANQAARLNIVRALRYE